MTRLRFETQEPAAAAGQHTDDALATAEAQMAAGAYREALLTVEEALLSLETTACLRSRADSWLAAASPDLQLADPPDPRRF